MRAQLRPGDVLFTDEPGDGVSARTIGDTRLIEVEVDETWDPAGSAPPAIDEGARGPRDRPSLSEMYVQDARAHLRDFERLFPGAPGTSADQPVLAMTFMCLSPGLFGDWHTEKTTSLVIGLAGGFELEVGGEGRRRVLRAGDLCLIRDDEGQGHISRTHGETRFVQLVLPTDHRWVLPDTDREA
jgi:quercetin dioxygenase-like cupin family protein